MFYRKLTPNETVVAYGAKFPHIYFIMKGSIKLFIKSSNKRPVTKFLKLPTKTTFGSY
jgi:CRP-like cAMP-binding protein